MNQLAHAHGGDLDAIEKKYGILKSDIVDFSGNINPLGFSQSVSSELAQNISIVSTYPDKNYTALRNCISEYVGAHPNHITVGNGSTELISTFIKSIQSKNTIIIGPAYSEYEREAILSGGNFSYFQLEEQNNFVLNLDKLLKSLSKEVDLLIVCNPNNPTGTAITTQQMEKILNHCKKNSTYVMVDETYIEFSDDMNSICSIPLVEKYDNIFVIRGISKFFAAPGIRLGYGICSNDNFLKLLKQNQDPWSVNILAAFAGEKLFLDKEFISKTKLLITSERKKAILEINSWKNAKPYDSCSNFILLKILDDHIHSHEIFEKLISKKLLIRNAASFTFLNESYLRFCIQLPEQNKKLLTELKLMIEKND